MVDTNLNMDNLPLQPPPPKSFHPEHRALEQMKEREETRVLRPGRRPSSTRTTALGMKSRRSFEGALSSATVDRRPPSRSGGAGGPDAASTPQPRPHSDLIPGVTDDRYVAAWRKRGPVTLLNVAHPGGANAAIPTTTTIAGITGAESSTDARSSEDEGSCAAAVKRRTSSKPSNPKLQQTIQEVLSESSNDSTDEFLGSDNARQIQRQQQQPQQQQQQQQLEPQQLNQSASRQQKPPSYSPGQVSIGIRKSDHLQLDESGESESDHHVIPALSV